MRVPNPSPTLEKNRAPMGPGILSSIGAGVWRKAPSTFPDSNSVVEGREKHTPPPLKPSVFQGCNFCAYSWKLPAYSGAFLLTIDNFSFFTHSWSFFIYNFGFFAYSFSFFAYSGKVRLIRGLRDCKQRSLTVSKKAPTVSKKASPVFQGLGNLWCVPFPDLWFTSFSLVVPRTWYTP